ncbi:4-alpha-glucanotransferase [Aquipuribacter nitratireducens]|uniref:4-alpha-glucanotransferase n=1 Tax=Aquipuribacter nitratireducens TaxID=650104 RepID=A0ABW0GLE5_9MICO
MDDAADHAQGLDEDLARLADAYGVATDYWDWQGNHVVVPRATVLAVLAALEVDAATPEALQQALRDVDLGPWRRAVPACTVVREGREERVLVHVDDGWDARLSVVVEEGEERPLEQVAHDVPPRDVDGRRVGEAAFALPTDLPLGWHELHLRATPGDGGSATDATGVLVVSPERLELPPALAARRQWGFMTMLFQVRSEASWAFGDLADLTEVATWSAREHGAGFVLLNPLHATDPVPPVEASPYLPATRRFVNPLYLRVEDVRETAYLSAADRAVVEWHAEELRELNRDDVLIDRDLVWEAKRAALERVFRVPRSPARQSSFAAFQEREGEGLRDWATWCALREFYGEPSPRWPEHAGRPDTEAVAQLREELAERIEFHCWLQWLMDEQLAAAQRAAVEAGMGLGIIHDLAVGVHPDGADAWALQDSVARGVSVGAPPDAFNQQGQDWSQPPWRPDALAASAYAPLRDMLRAVLRHGGGIRIDHIIGLFRLWWIPSGAGPAAGTYVRFDHEAMIGVLALEAHRAGAVVVGEDLGNVEPWVRVYLRERGILGTSILWFEKDEDGTPLKPQKWRELCLATVTTHDLPPTAGYLAGEHIEVRERLGLLTRDVDEERAADTADRAAYLSMLSELGLLPDAPLERHTVEALHRLLTWTPSLLLGVALPDAVGDRRAINQPGTHLEYPNWRLPMADGVGVPVLVEDLVRSPRAANLAKVLREGL